jgi:hypothetical protein
MQVDSGANQVSKVFFSHYKITDLATRGRWGKKSEQAFEFQFELFQTLTQAQHPQESIGTWASLMFTSRPR